MLIHLNIQKLPYTFLASTQSFSSDMLYLHLTTKLQNIKTTKLVKSAVGLKKQKSHASAVPYAMMIDVEDDHQMLTS